MNHHHKYDSGNWVQAELRLTGIDSRMIGLLKAIAESGSINQAARQVKLSYKGAWQLIERANNLSPQLLISTTTGGSKGGGSSLTAAGRTLLNLFNEIDGKHRQFLDEINRELAANAELILLLKHLEVKTSAENQLFGKVSAIHLGAVIAEVFVELKAGLQIVVSVDLVTIQELDLRYQVDTMILINSSDIILTTEMDNTGLSARNQLKVKIVHIYSDNLNTKVIVQLSNGESLIITVTLASSLALGLTAGMECYAVFKSNAAMLGVIGG